MNGAVVGNGGGQWLVRGAKIAVFDLPPQSTDEEIELDLSDVERTSKRQVVAADDVLPDTVTSVTPVTTAPVPAPDAANTTSEVDVDDILTEVPVDPTVPFEMRVPDKVHARAARLAAQLPKAKGKAAAEPAVASAGSPSPTARETLDAAPVRRGLPLVPIFAVLFGACALLGLAAGVASYAYENGPIPPASAHTFKARLTPKVLAQHTTTSAEAIPTVHVDSLPRARR